MFLQHSGLSPSSVKIMTNILTLCGPNVITAYMSVHFPISTIGNFGIDDLNSGLFAAVHITLLTVNH